MSSGHSIRIQNAKSLTNQHELVKMLDAQRAEALPKLWRIRGVLNDWEYQFVEDFIKSPRGFDDNQRDAMDALRRKYERRLARLSPDKAAPLNSPDVTGKAISRVGNSRPTGSPADSFEGNAS